MDPTNDLQQQAQDFLRQLAEGDFAGGHRRFDQGLAQALPEAALRATWLQLIGQFGAFQKVLDCQVAKSQEYRVITVSGQFERAALDMRVVFNLGGQISGLNAQPTPMASPYHPPAYIQAAAFHEVEVIVGAGEWALPGTLSLPGVAGPFPAVVLVHGSGPQDRDETIGPNKPFRDLAGGLASQGIAVLRYEKRTKAHAGRLTPAKIAQLTVREETIEDARAAIRLLRQTPRIDAGRIYVLGHSLGATLAPWIGQDEPTLAGLIILAGLTRRLEDTILDQYTYLYSLGGAPTDEQAAELAGLRAKVARVKDPDLSDQTPAADLPLGIAPAYWLALRDYRPEEVAAALGMRILILQGGRDYQVTATADFPAWQRALAGRPGTISKLYPTLNHLFTDGEGPSTPREYLAEGHISGEVIQDISRWIGEG